MTIQELGKHFKHHFGFNPPIDMPLTFVAGFKNAQIDILKLDEEFAKKDSEYDPENCTYKGIENYSPADYVKEKFGEEAYNFLVKLL